MPRFDVQLDLALLAATLFPNKLLSRTVGEGGHSETAMQDIQFKLVIREDRISRLNALAFMLVGCQVAGWSTPTSSISWWTSPTSTYPSRAI